ncbi:GTP cyclohydrolase [Flavobacterium sp. CYK-4]|uniref:GTP cyclohydrolase n=1 Tax=Flavobacterium lotistagni TaxID=2709660 RepID=UPI001407F1F8|nr:GTP cyclohydrolase [Flavobacterium lotistagni]NHM07169.1 GTP cyclohydrolase [Flavobacterium lotistagni]
MITIEKVSSKKQLKSFVMFPFSLYENHPYWVPPLIGEEMETFDNNKNPALQTAEAHLYLAYKNGEIVGRIAAIINWNEVNLQGKKKVRFGWWDVIDEVEVTQALLEKVFELGKQHQLEHAEGPMGFSNLDKVGVLSQGFDFIGSMITWYNYPYYVSHLEQLGFVKEKEYFESNFSFDLVDPSFFVKVNDLVKKRYQLTPLNFTRTKDIMPYVDKMFDLFNTTYANLASFVAITDVQREYFKKKYIPFINPEYIKFIVDKNDTLIAFSIVMPSFSEALQKSKGKLFPFGWYHLLQARKHSKEVLFYLIGVAPEYQSKGITAIIFDEYYKTFKAKGITNCIRTPELEENHAIHNLWKHVDPRVTRRRRTYMKLINNE